MALTWGLGLPAASFAAWGGLQWLASLGFFVLMLEVLWGPRPTPIARR